MVQQLRYNKWYSQKGPNNKKLSWHTQDNPAADLLITIDSSWQAVAFYTANEFHVAENRRIGGEWVSAWICTVHNRWDPLMRRMHW